MEFEGSGTAMEQETISASEVGSVDEVLGATTIAEGAFDDFLGGDVPNVDKQVPKPDAHRGRINGVTSRTFDSGSTALQFSLTSADEGFDETYQLFLPKAFVADITVDPATLPTGELDETTGKVKGNQHAQYARSVRNNKGDAELQTYLTLAKEQGHLQTTKPTTFEELVSILNTVLSGVEVVFTRRAEGGDGPFADRLRVNRIVNINTAGNPKFHKKVRRAWEAV
jgi:hypothetical protein